MNRLERIVARWSLMFAVALIAIRMKLTRRTDRESALIYPLRGKRPVSRHRAAASRVPLDRIVLPDVKHDHFAEHHTSILDPIIAKGVAEAPFPNTFSSGVEAAANVIRAHVPSLTEAAKATIDDRHEMQFDGVEPWDWEDYAVRTCACGIEIDGFYAYVEHLLSLLGASD